MVKIRKEWLEEGPALGEGGRLDFHKVYLGNLKQAVGPECIYVALDWGGIDRSTVAKMHFLKNGTAVFVVFWDEGDAEKCVRALRSQHVPLVSPEGTSISAHRGEIQAFKRSGILDL